MNHNRTIISLACTGVLLGIGTKAAAQSVSVADYDKATSAYEESYINGALNASKTRGDGQSGYDANLSVDYDKVTSSPDQDIRYQLNGTGSASRGSAAGAGSTTNYSVGAGVTVDNYFTPGSDGGFWYGAVNLQANDAFDNRQITGILGAGYGRVRNVTPMAKAIRIVEELTVRGQLTGTPPLGVYQAVANIIDREAEYRSKHGLKDFEQVWINDIAKVFTDSGLTDENFGAAEIIKILRILTDERISTRKVGWKVRAGVGYVFRSFDGTSGSDPALEVGAEYHHPLSNRTQFSNEAIFTSILNDGDESFQLRNAMTLTHEIDDRIDWENAWIYDYAKDGPSGTGVTTNTLSTALYYSLSNQLDVGATVSLARISGDTTAANPDGIDRSLFLGVRYRLK